MSPSWRHGHRREVVGGAQQRARAGAASHDAERSTLYFLHGSAERLQLDTLDCGRGMGLEHEATAMAVVD